MNIQTIRQKIREFITARIAIYEWDLDEPDVLYFQVGSQGYPANTAIELPVMNLVHTRGSGKSSIETSARFGYRLTYIFPGNIPLNQLPLKALEGILSTIHVYSILQTPDSDIKSFTPVEEEDSVTVGRVGTADDNWLIQLNFSFDAVFNTTELPDISDIQPPDYFDFNNPPTLQELEIRVNRAKPKFSRLDNSTFIEDSVILIN
jgi:hypothetical protein